MMRKVNILSSIFKQQKPNMVFQSVYNFRNNKGYFNN